MLLAWIAILGGLLLLVLAPDRFVGGSAGLADRRGVSRVVIGAVVIGFGTSAPELLVSGIAAIQGDPQIGVGNIVGSNMANLGLIVAVAALVGHVAVPTGLLRRELPLMVAATVAFAVAVQNGLAWWEGVLLLACLGAALTVIIRSADLPATAEETELADEVGEHIDDEVSQAPWRLAVVTIAGLLGTLAGAQLLVTGAVDIAHELDLSGGFVGMTIVALGTSLPELVTAIAAARAGEDQLILGNVLGSNLFNCLAVGAVVALAGGDASTGAGVTPSAIGLMLALTALAAGAMIRRQLVTRFEAATLLATYLTVLPLVSL